MKKKNKTIVLQIEPDWLHKSIALESETAVAYSNYNHFVTDEFTEGTIGW